MSGSERITLNNLLSFNIDPLLLPFDFNMLCVRLYSDPMDLLWHAGLESLLLKAVHTASSILTEKVQIPMNPTEGAKKKNLH